MLLNIIKLFPLINQDLHLLWYSHIYCDFILQIFDFPVRLHVNSNRRPIDGFHKDLHIAHLSRFMFFRILILYFDIVNFRNL